MKSSNLIKLFLFIVSYLFCASNDTIFFKSANPFSFRDIIQPKQNSPEQNIYGVLQLPTDIDVDDKVPLVIGVPGSKNWSKHHLEYMQMYLEDGFATFQLHSFDSRNIKSTVGNQTQVTTAMMILDSYKAFEILAEHPNINKDKVAITGWSLGGGVALFSAWKPLKNAINTKLKFAAHLSYYPPCIVEPNILEFTDSPIHLLLGELDNWVPAEACVDLCSKMKLKGAEIGYTIFKNAHHSFDRQGPVKVVDNGYLLEDCRLEMNSKGEVLMNFFKIPMTTPLLQKVGLAICTGGIRAKRGPSFGGNPEARDKSFEFSRKFMNLHLH